MRKICAVILSLVLILNLATLSFAGGESGAINSSSYGNTYVIKDDGSLWGWGGNYVGNGMGYKEKQLTPVKILENVRSVSAGSTSTFVAVKKDDTLWGWGSFSGKPADKNNPTYLTPIQLNIDNVKEASAGKNFVLVLKHDNTLWACGNTLLGDGTTNRADGSEGFVLIQNNIKSMYTADSNVYFIKEDDSLWGYGDNASAQLANMTTEGDGLDNNANHHTPIKILDDVKSVNADSDSAVILAIRLDNSLYAWGDGGFYTEQGYVEDAGKPYKVMEGVKTVAISGDVAFIVKTDSSLWSWGYDYQTGNDANEKSLYKILDGVQSVTVGERHASIVKTDHTLWTMGGNYRGGLGHTGDESWYTPLTKIISNVQDSPDSWAMAEVEKAIGEKLIPEDMQSNYTKSITREEFCILAIRMIEVRADMTIDAYLEAASLEIAPASTFEDCDTKEVLAAKALGITSGMTPTTFEPDTLLTREQAAKFLTTTAMACGKDVELSAPSYEDFDDIAGWAQPYTGYVYDINVMKGTGGNRFSPRDSYQRQQAFMTMYRIWQAIETVNPENLGASNDASVFSAADYKKKTRYTDLGEIKIILNSLDYSNSEETKHIKFTFKEISTERSEDVTVLYKGKNIREERPEGLNGDTTTIYNEVNQGTFAIVRPGNYTDYKEGNTLYRYRLNSGILNDFQNEVGVLNLEASIYLGIFHLQINNNDQSIEKYSYSVDSGIPISYIKMIYNASGDLESQVDWEEIEIDSTFVSPDSIFIIPKNPES